MNTKKKVEFFVLQKEIQYKPPGPNGRECDVCPAHHSYGQRRIIVVLKTGSKKAWAKSDLVVNLITKA